uniref:COP9 signalosome complex subunit 9 n=2 Tax=Pseudocrenilabrinae TaxID=318546 RepID=A0A3Q4GGI4_NEOBR
MKPAVDEMFPEGAGPYVDLDEAGGSSGLLMDLAANEKAVHSDFFNGKGQVSASLPKLLNLMRIKFTSLIQFNEVRAYRVELELNINLVFIWHG